MNDLRFAFMPDRELDRRWGLVRALLGENGLDALVTLCSDDDMGGYMRWLTDNPVMPYRRGAVFERDGGISVIEHGGRASYRNPNGNDLYNRGVDDIYGVAEFPAVDYSLSYEAEVMVSILGRKKARKIALVGTGNMPHRFVEHLTRHLGETVQFTDLTEAVDEIMVVKSPDEIAAIRKAAALQDQLLQLALKTVRPGITDAELTATLRAEAQKNGAEGGIILCGSGPQGSFAPFRPISRQNRTMRDGDYVSLLIENSAPGGYFTEIARNIVIGKAQAVLTEAAEAAKSLQDKILPVFQPGIACKDVYAQHNADRATIGQPPEDRIFAHGQGYNLVERPLIRQDETMTLNPGMNLAIHPTLADGKTVFSVMCDNFLLSEGGISERLHKTEQKVFEV